MAGNTSDKGKTFLVNDTFVRIDGAEHVIIQAWVGRMKAIHFTTERGTSLIQTPLKEGYVILDKESDFGRHQYKIRPMNGAEVIDSQKDHVALRANSMSKDKIWAEYYKKTDSYGETNADLHLKALNDKIYEERKKYVQKNPNWNLVDLMKNTIGWN